MCPLPFYSWQFNHIWHLVEEQSCFCLPTINNDNISDGTAITYSDLEPSTKEMMWSSLKEHGGTLKNYQLLQISRVLGTADPSLINKQTLQIFQPYSKKKKATSVYTTLYKDMSSIALQQHHSKHFAHREECDKNIQQISIANNQSKGPPKVRSWPAALPRNANLFDPGGYHSSLVAHDQHCCLPLYIHSFTAASSCYSATANDVAGQILFLIDTCGLVFFSSAVEFIKKSTWMRCVFEGHLLIH